MTMNRVGDWMTTYTGKQFWPLDPRPDEVCIEDIAHALALTCRFGGHCSTHYSVAQHSCLVADVVSKVDPDPQFVLWGLMHDAAEAYIGDMVRPFKRELEKLGVGIDRIEANILTAIARQLGLCTHMPKVVEWADDVVLMNEHKHLVKDGRKWAVDDIGGPAVDVQPCSWMAAEAIFLRKFEVWSA